MHTMLACVVLLSLAASAQEAGDVGAGMNMPLNMSGTDEGDDVAEGTSSKGKEPNLPETGSKTNTKPKPTDEVDTGSRSRSKGKGKGKGKDKPKRPKTGSKTNTKPKPTDEVDTGSRSRSKGKGKDKPKLPETGSKTNTKPKPTDEVDTGSRSKSKNKGKDKPKLPETGSKTNTKPNPTDEVDTGSRSKSKSKGKVDSTTMSNSTSTSADKSDTASMEKDNTNSTSNTTSHSRAHTDAKAPLQCEHTTCFCEDDDTCGPFLCSAPASCAGSLMLMSAADADIECAGAASCSTSHLQCLTSPGGSCVAQCTGADSCKNLRSFAEADITTEYAFAKEGEPYGMWLSGGRGELHCANTEACTGSAVGLASEAALVVCSAEHACSATHITATHTVEDLHIKCTAQESCQHAQMNITAGNTVVWCTRTRSCHNATITCPDSHDCNVHCSGPESCQDVHLLCHGSECTIDCIGKDSCKGAHTTGQACAVCTTDDCSGLHPCGTPPTPAPPTPAPPTPLPNPPGFFAITQRVFSFSLYLASEDFNSTSFITSLEAVLADLASSVTIYWSCPAVVCSNGCPVSASAKRLAGCASMDSRSGAALSSGVVVLVGVAYLPSGSEETVLGVLQKDGVLEEFHLGEVEVMETEVLIERDDGVDTSAEGPASGSSDDNATLKKVVLIAAVVVAVLCCCAATYLSRRGKKQPPSTAYGAEMESSKSDDECMSDR